MHIDICRIRSKTCVSSIILKIVCFFLVQYCSDWSNHLEAPMQCVGQKMMTGCHYQQGVPETQKIGGVISERPHRTSRCGLLTDTARSGQGEPPRLQLSRQPWLESWSPPHLEPWSGGDFNFTGMATCKVEVTPTSSTSLGGFTLGWPSCICHPCIQHCNKRECCTLQFFACHHMCRWSLWWMNCCSKRGQRSRFKCRGVAFLMMYLTEMKQYNILFHNE